MLLALAGALVYFSFKNISPLAKGALFLILVSLLDFTAGAWFLCFAFLAAIREISLRKHAWLSVPFLALAGLLPLISRFLFVISLRQAFTAQLPTGHYPSLWIGALSVVIVPLLLIMSILWGPFTDDRRVYRAGRWILIAGLAVFALSTRRMSEKNQWQCLKYARDHAWNPLTGLVEKLPYRDPILTIESNRALYHTGRMGNKLFAFPQMYGSQGLIIMDPVKFRYPIEKSDLELDLGFINEAVHWASEALSLQGETPYVLRQLATLYIIKKDYGIARLFLSRLRHTLIFDRDPWISKIRANLFDSDFIVEPAHPRLYLEALVRQNPENRMAYEYDLMTSLLKKDLTAFIKTIAGASGYFPDLLPVHYEEALLLSVYILNGKDIDPDRFHLRKSTVDRFQTFRNIISRYRGNLANARPAMAKELKSTYWFYYMYQKGNRQ